LRSPDNNIASYFLRLWYDYKLFVKKAMIGHAPVEIKGIVYWQEKLFTNTIAYSLPLSLIAIIPSVFITYAQGSILVPVIDIVALVSILLVTLNPRISISFKKAFVAITLYLLAVMLMISLGSFGIGSIYILALSVFLSLLFPNRVAYASIAVNFIIYAGLALIIYYKVFDTLLYKNYSIDYWIGYSLNFMFLNVAVIVQIRYIFNGLKNILVQEAQLRKELQVELDEKQQRNNILKESEGHYKSLFLHNPSPMWIYDVDTLQFLQVNNSAVKKYGYTEEEFLDMTIKGVRPKENLNDLYEMLGNHVKKNGISENVTRHMRKGGEAFYVEVICSSIPFKGKEACLVITRDITTQIEHTQAIEKQNEKLKEIAHLQSHVVRAPLARIMGLTNLITQDKNNDKQLLEYLDISVHELDGVIRAIVSHGEDLVPIPQQTHLNIGK
jgi:PAS domain S-box-containing protein